MSVAVLDPLPAASSAKPSCRHCGAGLLDARMRETGFCCSGCSYVYRLVHEHGLAGYYRIKDEITAPADAAVFQPRDYTWLDSLQADAEGDATRIPELTLDVQGISCAACVWLIERVFRQQPGARDIMVNAAYGTMRLRWVRGEFSAAGFARKLQAFGYLAGPPGEAVAEPESRGLVKRIGLCAAFAMNTMLFSLPTYFGMQPGEDWADLFGLLNVVFGTLSLLVGGLYFLTRAVQALRERALHIDLPIALGIVGAYAGSLYGWFAGEEHFVYFDFVSAFILLMLTGRWAQVAAVERNRRRLLSRQPKPDRVSLADGRAVAPEQLRVDDTFALRSGQTLPVESRLESPAATFSLASINGEADARVYRAGQRVPAGAVNLGRSDVRLVAQQRWSESLLAQLLAPAERTAARHVLLERIVRGYLVGILGIAVLSGIGWWLATGDALHTGAVVTAVLVVSCPCAIALAFPLADEIATVALRRRGVFVRHGDLWPKLSRVRTLVFDKTGTLTLETPVLQNPSALAGLDGSARAALHALVRDNPHPVSQCLLENLLALGPVDPLPGTVAETIGAGLTLGPWSLGRPGWRESGPREANARESGARESYPRETPAPLRHLLSDTLLPSFGGSENAQRHLISDIVRSTAAAGVGNSVFTADAVRASEAVPAGDGEVAGDAAMAADAVLACDGEVRARFRFADTVRPEAKAEIAALARRGFDIVILSGDRREKVSALARELGLPADRALGELSPQAKAAWLEAHGADRALMLGDGANDSLAFDRALCRGTPVVHRGVLERKADFYYLGRGIGGLRALFEVDAIRRRTQRTILIFSVVYNVLAVSLAVAGHMNPLLAAILMPVNSLATLILVTGGMRGATRL